MRTNPASMIKGAVIAFLMAVLILIGWNFITQSRKKPKIPEESEEIETQKVEKKEKIEHFEVKGVRGDFRVKADKHYRGDDSKYHLEGNVEVIFFRRREGKDIFIHADEIIYDEGWNHFLIPAEGHIRSEDILVEAAALEYDDEREVFVSNDGVRFSSKAISGSADRMAYSLKEERIDLQDNVFLTIRPLLGTSFPLQLKGRRFAYSRIKRKGTMEGEVLITHGRSQAWADYCGFELFADEEQVKSLHLKGTVRATLIDELSDISGEGTSFVLYGKKQEIIADEIRLRGFIDLPKVHALEATGHCSFKFYSSEGEMTLIEGDFVEFVLSREGQLREFKAQKRVRLVEKDKDTGEVRIIEGEVFRAHADKILSVRGDEKAKPKILFKGNEILSEEISLSLDTGDLDVSGEVKMALQLHKDKKPVGFFSKKMPIFILSHGMRYSEKEKRFLFKEGTKMWQSKKTLAAESVRLDEETGRLFCSGEVKSIIPYRHKGREEERLEVSAETMSFEPEENVISFTQKSSLRLKNIHLRSRSIYIHLKEKNGEMEKIVARGKVVVVQDEKQGQGQEGIYEFEEEALTLLGNPVLIDKDKGRIRGDKLTFHMSDGRIVVENKDRERSVTVIKS